ncbi:MAG TPA: recombinase family protein [Caulobacteraceae bacterium]
MRELPPPGTLVAPYARYSTTNQKFKSIEDQLALCRDYAKKHDWIIVAEYFDAARTGSMMVGREGFLNMMLAAERGEFEVVLTEDFDRISRTASHAHSVYEDLEELGIKICTVVQGVVSDVDLSFEATKNAHYRKQNSFKTRRGQEGTVRSGRIVGSRAYGYRKVVDAEGRRGLRAIVPEQAAVIERIFEDYVAGVGTFDICRKLNAEGVPSPGGAAWKPGTLTGSKDRGSGILRNRLYVGVNEWARTTRRRRKKTGRMVTKSTPLTDRIVVPVPDMRIISDELFEAAQARLEATSAENFNELRRPQYLFTGKLVCAECGSSFTLVCKRLACSGRFQKGICSVRRRVKREDLEEAVLAGLKEALLLPELIEPCLEQYKAERERALEEFHRRTETAATRLKHVEKEIANVLASIREGRARGFAAEVLMEDVNRLEAERRRLQKACSAGGARNPTPLNSEDILHRIGALIEDLRGALDSDDREAVRARELVRGLVDRIVIKTVPVEKEDGRGAGPVSITVEGRLTRLFDLPELQSGRIIQPDSRTGVRLDDSILRFSFEAQIGYKDPYLKRVYPDADVLAGMLHAAEAPVTKKMLREKLAELSPPTDDDQARELELRARRAIAYLRRTGKARLVRDCRRSGLVWNSVPLTDEQWVERARRQGAGSEPDADAALLEGDLAQGMSAAGPLDEAVGEHPAVPVEDHRVRRRGRIKADRSERHASGAKLPVARRTAAGRQE